MLKESSFFQARKDVPMPKAIPVAIVTNRDGTHLEQWLPSLAAIEEVDTVDLVDPSGHWADPARKALGKKLRAEAIASADQAVIETRNATLRFVTCPPRGAFGAGDRCPIHSDRCMTPINRPMIPKMNVAVIAIVSILQVR